MRRPGPPRPGGDCRGVALVTALFVMFAIGMLLLSFMSLAQSDLRGAALGRNGVQAFHLAEAGVQEALARLGAMGALPGRTVFTNSLAAGGAPRGSTATVVYEPPLETDAAVFPILSTATVAGSARRIRIVLRARAKMGPQEILYGSQVGLEGDASLITADIYARSSVTFRQYRASPLCAAGTTDAALPSPQVLAGTSIGAGSGPAVSPPCLSPQAANAGTYAAECANSAVALTEVAPTPCPQGGRAAGGGSRLPANWHPMTPIGMEPEDFASAMVTCAPPADCVGLGIEVVQATQGGEGVVYAPKGTYTPPYWAGVPSTRGKVELLAATRPFCVRASPPSVVSPAPPVVGECPAGYRYYGEHVGGAGQTTRYLDWGLVRDDLSSGPAATFFQPPTCRACNGGRPNGNQNGIRYIPLLPTPNVLAQACQQNTPGTNVFDQVNTDDGISCTDPSTRTIHAAHVTFRGTRTAPESLVIDNAGSSPVTISGSAPGTGGPGCGAADFDNAHWGIILATGDIKLAGGLTFTGFVYTSGSITAEGAVTVRGGVYAAGAPGSSRAAHQVTSLGTLTLCPAQAGALLLTPLFMEFTPLSWQDVPLGRP